MADVAWRFCGREVQPNERALIQDVVARFPGLSRSELALTAGSGLASDYLRAEGYDLLPVTTCEVRPEPWKTIAHVHGP